MQPYKHPLPSTKSGFWAVLERGTSVIFYHVRSCWIMLKTDVPSCPIMLNIMFHHYQNVWSFPQCQSLSINENHKDHNFPSSNQHWNHQFPSFSPWKFTSSIHFPSKFTFPIIFPSFSHHFPMIFPWFSHDFPMISPWFPHQNSHLWTTGPPSEASFCRQLSQEVHPSVAGTVDLDPTGSTWECSSIWIYYLTSNCTNQLSIRFFGVSKIHHGL